MKKVFLIDDDDDDREIFQLALTASGLPYHYAEARNGEDALYKIKGANFARPDIIFLDLNMPKIDGRQFLKLVKQIDGYKEVPVYIYTMSANESERITALINGAAGFITKHNSVAELRATLEQVLS